MTAEEEQAAKSAVEAARFGTLVEPTDEDLIAIRKEANAEAALVDAAADFDQLQPVSDDAHGKPTLQGS